MARVLVTGAGGFVGRALVRALAARGHTVTALGRREAPVPLGCVWRRGDLLEPASYGEALAGVEAVLHLAAATGRAPAREHWRVNVEGTRALLGVCQAAGVPRVLFVSSVAVQFPEHTRYPYAQSKAQAEAAVRSCRLRHVIVRPTIVAGPGSPVVRVLARLARLPVVLVFGDGRTRVQPIDVDDLATLLVDVVERDRFEGETIGLGGPEAVTIEDLLQGVRRAAGLPPGRAVHVPLGVVLPALAIAEALVPPSLLPFTSGQLGTFRFDGTVAPHPLVEARRAALRPLAAMLGRSLA